MNLQTSTRTTPRATIRDYIGLTKPRIIELLLVTTIPTMMFAASGWPSAGVAIATLIGGTLAAAGANVLNCYIDMDIDALMPRTAHRATVTGAISARATVMFGLVLSLLSTLVLATFTNTLAASFAALAIIFYVGVYSLLLKRRTAQNIVWGGIAGCFPVIIGWTAVTDSISWEPLVLFLVVFLWTPPHYWPLSIKYRDEYAAASIPMLPVVATDVVVARQIIIYSWAMVGASLALIPATGLVYAAAAVFAGAWFIFQSYQLQRVIRRGVDAAKPAMRLFHGSISYLSILFLAVGIDSLLK